MSLYPIVLEIKKLLGAVDTWLDKATAHAAAKKYDVNTLLQSRLAPDMFPLVRQIQSTCDQAKYAAGRTAGKDVPSHPDTEQTIDELRKRIATVVAYLGELTARDFEGTDARSIALPRWEGKSMTATDYFVEHAMPNFFFHLTTVYAILRHNGIDVGKRDYLGALSFR
ncbi:MAG TPA: DUF1993 domain-containing protein [Kofleriaceae bacterium]|nr:DUF1993 domain-containing protein [Kofleriaceae bacterium]